MTWFFIGAALLVVLGIIGARSGTAAPAPAPAIPPVATAETRLSIELDHHFTGEHDLIVQTLNDLATLLQQQVDARASRAARVPPTKAIAAPPYLSMLSAEFQRLAQTFDRAEREFERAVGPDGSPELYGQAYASVVDDLIAARDAILPLKPPPQYAAAELAFAQFVDSIYAQIAAWPADFAAAAKSVMGQSADLRLSASYDVGPLQRAIA